MADAPTLLTLTPPTGSTVEETLVTVTGTGFQPAFPPPAVGRAINPPAVRVLVNGRPSPRVINLSPTQLRVVMPPGDAGPAVVRVENMQLDGEPVPGEWAERSDLFAYQRPGAGNLGREREGMLNRVVRTVIDRLRARVLENVAVTTATDYDDTPEDMLGRAAVSRLPALVLTGPERRRAMQQNTPPRVVPDGAGGYLTLPPADIRDLAFTLVVLTNHTQQLLDLIDTIEKLHRRDPYLVLPVDAAQPAGPVYRLPCVVTFDGGARVVADGNASNIRSASLAFVVKNVPLETRGPLDQTAPVAGDYVPPGAVPETAAAAALVTTHPLPES